MIEGMSAEEKAEMSPEWLGRVETASTPDPWTHGFKLVLQTSGNIVGHCGFKAPPDKNGMVEIAYGIDPDHQGQGYATEAAQALTAWAFSTGEVRIVRAHTQLESEASMKVLIKCGFKRIGEVTDPEDGQVCRWEISNESS
jgi:RimJ/RimL family protein N-acetyltransferase